METIARRLPSDALKIALASKTIETVVLSNFIPFFSTKDADSRSVYRLNGHPLSNREAFQAGRGRFCGQPAEGRQKVVFVVDVPHLRADPRDCVQRLPFLAPRRCEYTSAENEAKRKAYLDAIAELKGKYAGLEVFDPTGEFCQGDGAGLRTGARCCMRTITT